jgi:hypothetical protein
MRGQLFETILWKKGREEKDYDSYLRYFFELQPFFSREQSEKPHEEGSARESLAEMMQ